MPKQHPNEVSGPANDPAQPIILLVDDHEAMRAALLELLNAAFPACRFLEAISGEEALAITVSQPTDIVLMDFSLPHMNGLEATRRLRAISPSIQVVIMSFHEAQRYRADAEAAGASAFVPIRTLPIELVPILESLLAKAMATKTKD